MQPPLGAVHTVALGPVWANVQDGRVLMRHHEREEAVTAGIEIARVLEVDHVICPEDHATAVPPSDDAPTG